MPTKITIDVPDEIFIKLLEDVIDLTLSCAVGATEPPNQQNALNREYLAHDLLSAIEIAQAANRLIRYAGGCEVNIAEALVRYERERRYVLEGDKEDGGNGEDDSN